MAKLSLHDRVEYFLSTAIYYTFAYGDKPVIFSFLFEEADLTLFNNKNSHEDLRDYFRGRKLKLVVYTPDETSTTISLVDTNTADTIIMEGGKFITNNLVLFCEAKLPEDTVFVVNLMCAGKTATGEKGMGLHPYWLDKKPLQIHGYSIIDKRSI